MSEETVTVDGEIVDLEVVPTTALEGLNRAEIDMQIATAKRWPRSITDFKRKALELATLNEETAAAMFYSLKRGSKRIEGPSVRLAEIAAYSWKNLRFGARVIAVEQKQVVAQGFAFDLENNTASSVEVRRRITNSEGQRYNEDMITMTANAACSIAFRNAIYKVIPQALLLDVYKLARETATGKSLTMEQRREKILADMAKIDAKPEQVYKLVDKKSKDDITIDDILFLKGLITSIQDGETTLKTALSEGEIVPATTKLGDLTAALKVKSQGEPISNPAQRGKIEDGKEPLSAADRAILDELK